MRRIIATAICAVLAVPALAHDFWLQPRGFQFPQPLTVPIIALVGHGPDRQRWGVGADHVVLFRSFGPGGMTDRRSELTLGGDTADAAVRLVQPGSYVLAFQSSATPSDLPFVRYNSYLALEGLTPAIEYRRRTGTERTDGHEIYSRRAKAIVQVGPVRSASERLVTSRLGLNLEIVPERHPYLLRPGEQLPVRVYFEGQPLAGALVKLTNLDFDTRPVEMHRTASDGRTRFSVPRHGAWLVNVIWTKKLPGNTQGAFETTFSSLTFGY